MKHHFGDWLDRSAGHWSITPNRERWRCHFDDLETAPDDIAALTVTKNDRNWDQISRFLELRELTLHEPSPEQVLALELVPNLKVLRITHCRAKSLEVLRHTPLITELVLEYVSGISDMDAVGALPKLAALHLENLRNVSNFGGLSTAQSLRYLSIDGTPDWAQPINDFDFMRQMVNLEYFRLGNIRPPKLSMPLSPLVDLNRLKVVKFSTNAFPLEVFAWIAAKLPHVEGAVRPAYQKYGGFDRELSQRDYRSRSSLDEFAKWPNLFVGVDGKRYEHVPYDALLLGRGLRTVTGTPEEVDAKCENFQRKFDQLLASFARC
jgi:hypothetical protein